VYATCSILPEENEEIVAAFLGEHPQFRLASAGEILARQRIPLQMGQELRLLPHVHDTDGFFAVVLERTAAEAVAGEAALSPDTQDGGAA
jgi:16S rRNA (cytosine967-C5)-methyltransferase